MAILSGHFPLLSREKQEQVVAFLFPDDVFWLEEANPSLGDFGGETRWYLRQLSRFIYDVGYETNDNAVPFPFHKPLKVFNLLERKVRDFMINRGLGYLLAVSFQDLYIAKDLFHRLDVSDLNHLLAAGYTFSIVSSTAGFPSLIYIESFSNNMYNYDEFLEMLIELDHDRSIYSYFRNIMESYYNHFYRVVPEAADEAWDYLFYPYV